MVAERPSRAALLLGAIGEGILAAVFSWSVRLVKSTEEINGEA